MNDDFFYKINKDYIEIKDILDDYQKVSEFFNLNETQITSLIVMLRSAKENGYIEVKENLLKNIYSILDDGLYKVLGADKIIDILNKSVLLLLTTIIIRKVFYGTNQVKIAINSESIDASSDNKEIDIKTIIAYTNDLAKQDKGIVLNKFYKEILIKVKNYNDEIKKVNELAKNLSGEKKIQMVENSKKKLIEISDGVKKSYILLQKDIFESKNNIVEKKDLLSVLKFSTVLPVISEQLSNYSRLYSSLKFIKNEKSNLLKVIEKMHSKFDDFIKLIHKEEQLLLNLLIKNKIESTKIDELINTITENIISVLNNNIIKKDKPT